MTRGSNRRWHGQSSGATAPLLAASIFLDILNVFLLLLSLFGDSKD